MSWSISFIGKASNVVEALEKHSEKLDGASKEEFDAALPNIIGLIKLNSNSQIEPVIQIVGSGHGSGNYYNTCSINISTTGSTVV